MGQVTIKATVQKPRRDGRFLLYFRVQKDKRIQYILTDKVVTAEQLNKDKEPKEPYLRRWCADRIDEYYEKLNHINATDWDVKQVVAFLKENGDHLSFSKFCRDYIDQMVNDGHERTAKDYRAALKSIENYAGTDNIYFSQITSNFLQGWIKTQTEFKRCKERYPICMRYVHKIARERLNDSEVGVIRIPGNPWEHVKIPKGDIPEQRAADPGDLRLFFAHEVEPSRFVHPMKELGQDVAKMIFCLGGINTVDLYQLKKKDYYDGIIHYCRQKVTSKRNDKGYFEMRVPGLLLPLFEKYKARDDDEYLFNFHRNYSSCDSFSANINTGIHQVVDAVNAEIRKEDEDAEGIADMQGYTFRHSAATIAQNECGASLGDVDFLLNHSSGHRLAKVYTKINFEPAWILNEKVVEFLFFTDKGSSRKHKELEGIDKLSSKNMMKAEAYFMGKCVGKIQDIGFRNVHQVIEAVMAKVPEDYAGKTIQMKVENLDKETSQFYEQKK